MGGEEKEKEKRDKRGPFKINTTDTFCFIHFSWIKVLQQYKINHFTYYTTRYLLLLALEYYLRQANTSIISIRLKQQCCSIAPLVPGSSSAQQSWWCGYTGRKSLLSQQTSPCNHRSTIYRYDYVYGKIGTTRKQRVQGHSVLKSHKKSIQEMF